MNTDAELLSRTIAGDSGAFAELYNRYKSELYCYARAILRDRALAEDVIHDTFIQLFKAGHTIHSPGGSSQVAVCRCPPIVFQHSLSEPTF